MVDDIVSMQPHVSFSSIDVTGCEELKNLIAREHPEQHHSIVKIKIEITFASDM